MDPNANRVEYPSPLTRDALSASTRGAFTGDAFTPPVNPTPDDVRSAVERTQAALAAEGPRCDVPVEVPGAEGVTTTEPCCLPAGHDPGPNGGDGHSVLRLAVVDGSDALVAVIIRRHPGDAKRVVVDANANGADKRQAADWLRQIADSWDPWRPEVPSGEAPDRLDARRAD